MGNKLKGDFMKYLMLPAMLLAVAPAYAQDTAKKPDAVPATVVPPSSVMATARSVTPGGSAVLPSNTEVLVSTNSEINSKKVREGDKFVLSVAQDVMLGNYIVIPRGTPAHGVVTYRTGKGAFGKSAKMEIEVRSLDLNGRSVPLVGHFRQEGRGNTGATVGAVVAVGVFSAFVTGRSAVIEQGREFRVYTREPLDVTIPGAAPAPSNP